MLIPVPLLSCPKRSTTVPLALMDTSALQGDFARAHDNLVTNLTMKIISEKMKHTDLFTVLSTPLTFLQSQELLSPGGGGCGG